MQRRTPALFSPSTATAVVAAISAGLALWYYFRETETDSTTLQSDVSESHVSILPRRLSKPKEIEKITLSLENTLLWNPSHDPKSPNYAFLERAIPFAIALCQRYRVFFIMRVSSDEEEDQVRRLLQQSQIDWSRLIFCEKEDSKVHIIRHIEPSTHIDSSLEVVKQAAKYVPRILYVNRLRAQSDYGSSDTLHETELDSSLGLPKNVSTVCSIFESKLLQRK